MRFLALHFQQREVVEVVRSFPCSILVNGGELTQCQVLSLIRPFLREMYAALRGECGRQLRLLVEWCGRGSIESEET